MLYSLTVLLHVLTAVLGIGQIVAIAVLASATGKGEPAPAVTAALKALTRSANWSALVMLLTGVAIDLTGGRVFDRTWWFRGSTLLLLALGALLGIVQGALRKAEPGYIGKVGGLARWMCVVVAALVVLMVLKPG
jgi:hypothetical protein